MLGAFEWHCLRLKLHRRLIFSDEMRQVFKRSPTEIRFNRWTHQVQTKPTNVVTKRLVSSEYDTLDLPSKRLIKKHNLIFAIWNVKTVRFFKRQWINLCRYLTWTFLVLYISIICWRLHLSQGKSIVYNWRAILIINFPHLFQHLYVWVSEWMYVMRITYRLDIVFQLHLLSFRHFKSRVCVK